MGFWKAVKRVVGAPAQLTSKALNKTPLGPIANRLPLGAVAPGVGKLPQGNSLIGNIGQRIGAFTQTPNPTPMPNAPARGFSSVLTPTRRK